MCTQLLREARIASVGLSNLVLQSLDGLADFAALTLQTRIDLQRSGLGEGTPGKWLWTQTRKRTDAEVS